MYKNKISNPCYRESGISSSSVHSRAELPIDDRGTTKGGKKLCDA